MGDPHVNTTRRGGKGDKDFKFVINRAVRWSQLPAPSRLIMMVLVDISNSDTGEIPPQHTPSLAMLVRQTSLGKSTVAEHLGRLEKAGWVKRTAPDLWGRGQHQRTKYELAVGAPRYDKPGRQDDEPGAPEGPEDVPDADDPGPSHGHGDVREADDPSPAPGPGHVREPDAPMSGSRTSNTYQPQASNQKRVVGDEDTPSGRAAPPLREDVERLCVRLAERLVADGDRPPRITKAWRAATAQLLDADGLTERQIAAAIDFAIGDTYWRTAIASPMSLRKNYDLLRKTAEAARRRAEQKAAEAAAADEARRPPATKIVPPAGPPSSRETTADAAERARQGMRATAEEARRLMQARQDRTTARAAEPVTPTGDTE